MADVSKEMIAFAHDIADGARHIVRQHFRTKLNVETKEDDSPVTLVDRQVEALIREKLSSDFPSHGILGEEYGHQKPESHCGYTWVIDPIDGTKSFMAGRLNFGTLISLFYENEPIFGLIDQPITQERWVGLKGCESTYNNQPISTRSCAHINQAVLATTDPELFTPQAQKAFYEVSKQSKVTLYGGDCYNYGLLAMGLIDVVVEDDLKVYDYGALVPIIEGAGGVITDWNGKSLGLDSSSHVMACGDLKTHLKVQSFFV